ncbi:MAG: hypothetical protein WBN88_15695 [Anderseniella sp.]
MLHEVHYETFALSEDQHHNLWAALARAAQIADTRSKLPKSALLDLVISDFLATNTFGMRENPESQRQYIAKVERVIGKRIVLVNPKTKKIECGFDALEAIVQKGDQDE